MSRLDEALRRSYGELSTPDSPRGQRAGVFESPWPVGPAGLDTARPPEPPPAKDREEPTPETGSDLRVLAAKPVDMSDSSWAPWLLSSDRDPALLEQFRRLAASLLHGQRDGRLKVMMVTSAVPGEGKTLTSLNIALVLASSYRRRVLLIDADLRRPRLSEAANLTVTEGLSEVLKAPDDRKAALAQLTDHLWFLPAGRPDPEPLSGLTSPRMQRLLEEAAERFDWVIVDTAPVVAAADAGLLGAMVDATLLVVRAGQTPHPAVRQAVETLGRDRIFGVVLNGVSREQQDDYAAYTVTD